MLTGSRGFVRQKQSPSPSAFARLCRPSLISACSINFCFTKRYNMGNHAQVELSSTLLSSLRHDIPETHCYTCFPVDTAEEKIATDLVSKACDGPHLPLLAP